MQYTIIDHTFGQNSEFKLCNYWDHLAKNTGYFTGFPENFIKTLISSAPWDSCWPVSTVFSVSICSSFLMQSVSNLASLLCIL